MRFNAYCNIKPKFEIGQTVWIIDWIGWDKKSLLAFVRPIEVSGLTYHFDLLGNSSLVPDGYQFKGLGYEKIFTNQNVFATQEEAIEAIPNSWSI